jgi:crossover junction endodeoxyribonuclease RuvC
MGRASLRNFCWVGAPPADKRRWPSSRSSPLSLANDIRPIAPNLATPSTGTVRVLGIDPGLQLTGYGVIEYREAAATATPTLIDAGVIRLDGKRSVADRLVELERELCDIIEELRPTCCAVEELYSHYAHPTTAIIMGHARGVILLCARRHTLKLVELPASRVKKSLTGNGHASKEQMQRGVQMLFRLKDLPEPPDVADAVAIALCAARA